jgi:lipid-A-disaccharide synthase-like uncharacterized protein
MTAWTDILWEGAGILGAVIFFGRFYLQWIVSEREKRSVVPLAFWYMSTVGSLLLLAYGVRRGSAVGVLSYSFNIVVYARNLIHIWRERGQLTPKLEHRVHTGVAAVVLVAAGLVAYTWLHKYASTQLATPEEIRRTWFWIGVGVAGQGLFAFRFLLQWAATEIEQKSVIPVAFWYISLAASTLQIASYSQQREWIYAVGLATTILVYLRNLWLIHGHKPGTAPVE